MHNDKFLNQKQKEAVEYDNGPLLIIAGAGTGKTTVITERIKHLVLNKNLKSSNILALTFTEKASKEMEERVDVVMPYGYWDMWISTFHSFCERILRSWAFHIGYDPSFKLMSTLESIAFIKKHLYKFRLSYFRPLGNPNRFIDHLIAHFSRLQDEDIAPNQYLEWIKLKSENFGLKLDELQKIDEIKNDEKAIELAKWFELAKAYETYEFLKVEERVMDFGDLITKTLKLFRERPNILSMYRLQFAQILVDEFQDTNVAQYELLKLIAPPSANPNIVVVGDDSQSIYKFRGAAISNIMHFMDDYPTAKTVVLTENYRSTQTILDAAYRLIQHNNPDTLEARLGIEKKLVSKRNVKKDCKIELFHAPKDNLEAEEVADEIQRLVSQNLSQAEYGDGELPINYSDIAILVRARNYADIFIKALSKRGIPYHFYGPSSLFEQKEVSVLISYLKILKDQRDDTSWFNLLTSSPINVPLKDLTLMLSVVARKNLSLIDLFDDLDSIQKLEAETKSKIKNITDLVGKHLYEIKDKPAGQILVSFVNEMEILEEFINENSFESLDKAQNITRFLQEIVAFESQNKDSSIFSVLEWIDLVAELGEKTILSQQDYVKENAVNIMTVHSAKGLEFPVVFLVNLVSERFPSRNKGEAIPIPDELIKEVLPMG
ncbi:MAG: ATP-dependent helicase, partial [Patescibacteria group bacterium]|nr:ATP-dependent helicase [Patescibacteria group bacterium]